MKEKKLLLGAMLMLALVGMGLEGRELMQHLSQQDDAKGGGHNWLAEGSHGLSRLFQRVSLKSRNAANVEQQPSIAERVKILPLKPVEVKVHTAGVTWRESKERESYYQDSVVSSDYYSGYQIK